MGTEKQIKYWNSLKGKSSGVLGKHWKIKNTSKMHHPAWNKGKKLGFIPKGAFKKGHKSPNYWLGKKQPIEMIKKRAEKLKGNKSRTGQKTPIETLRKQIEAHKGNKTNFWKGGKMKNYPVLEQIRKSSEYKLWRKAIFERDNFICQKYGIKGGKLVAHHINNFADFSELRFAINNGITLSKKAHDEFHKKYGKNNNTKEQLEEFLTTKR